MAIIDELTFEEKIYQLLQDFNYTRSVTLEIFDRIDKAYINHQSIPEVSPAKWHLAHTTWFFETLILKKFLRDYQEINPQYNFLFNSYYNYFGTKVARDQRHLIDKPDVKSIIEYRKIIDKKLYQIFDRNLRDIDINSLKSFLEIFELGINHEQQHQELMLTDIKHVLYTEAQHLIYNESTHYALLHKRKNDNKKTGNWIYSSEALVNIGKNSNSPAFTYDNESPCHKFYLIPYLIYSQLATNEEYLEFMDSDGYNRPEFWLADGWDFIKKEKICAPLYWMKAETDWNIFTLGGIHRLDPTEPVSHISFYEADAFARWKKSRLPTEQEWEAYAQHYNNQGHFQEERIYHPLPKNNLEKYVCEGLWQFTASPYIPYPGYRQPKAELGEYNAKFMINQIVLRGGSVATPTNHYRHSYRNFFYPNQRWQFMGIRLAQNIS